MATSPDTPTPTSDRVQGIKASLESIRASVGSQLQKIWEHLPNKRQLQLTFKWFILNLLLFAAGLAVGTASVFTLTGGAVLVVVVAPFIIAFSPILVAFGGFLILVAAAVVTDTAIGYAAYYMANWFYEYVNGAEPVFSGYVDAAGNQIAATAHEVRRWARVHILGYNAFPRYPAAPAV